jgi:hypothetical protein
MLLFFSILDGILREQENTGVPVMRSEGPKIRPLKQSAPEENLVEHNFCQIYPKRGELFWGLVSLSSRFPGEMEKIIVSPLPRYIIPCCDEVDHITNRGEEDFKQHIVDGARVVR